MGLKLYNTLTRELENFTPIDKNKVNMYACGPTVYNYIHIGNARMAVFFDVLRRYLDFSGYDVTYVQNITDVDDRIIDASQKLGIRESEVSEKYTLEYNKDLSSLGVKTPSVQPKVTEHIPQIIRFIEGLIEKRMAYELNGDVYYRVEKFRDYGKLTNQRLDFLQSTERELKFVTEEKENAHDFALWKAQKGDEIAWDSPWGMGRPGWHIECSAMSLNYLGETFDIHGGGMDLCFPHHENEIAQSEALTGKPMANYWIHNNYVVVDGQKMSKSLGNFTTVKDALEEYTSNELRMFFLQVNYRNVLDYKKSALEQARATLARIQNTLDNLYHIKRLRKGNTLNPSVTALCSDLNKRFKETMDNDVDTANAIGLLVGFTKDINEKLDRNELNSNEAGVILDIIKMYGDVLGLQLKPELLVAPIEIEEAVQEREELKKQAKSAQTKEEKVMFFQKADRIRDWLSENGVLIEDTANGPRWKLKR